MVVLAVVLMAPFSHPGHGPGAVSGPVSPVSSETSQVAEPTVARAGVAQGCGLEGAAHPGRAGGVGLAPDATARGRTGLRTSTRGERRPPSAAATPAMSTALANPAENCAGWT